VINQRQAASSAALAVSLVLPFFSAKAADELGFLSLVFSCASLFFSFVAPD